MKYLLRFTADVIAFDIRLEYFWTTTMTTIVVVLIQ